MKTQLIIGVAMFWVLCLIVFIAVWHSFFTEDDQD